MVRLNLGAGERPLAGYQNLDIKDGRKAYPLPHADGSVDEVRASHILEHFSWRDSLAVLADWVRVLKPGGILKVAVPDFDRIVDLYREGTDLPVEQYLVGSQADAHDVHLSIWNEQKLREAMEHAGLVDIRRWESGVGDCAALPVSLNLMGRKPGAKEVEDGEPAERQIRHVVAAMSVPRLGFQDNFLCAFRALSRLRIPLRRHTGAFWGQCLERCMTEIVEEGKADAILTIDYDTVFNAEDVAALVELMRRHPEADAITTWQAARWRDTPLVTIPGEDGRAQARVPRAEIEKEELLRVATGHFGLTLIATEALRKVPHPWFKGEPDPETGLWNDRRCDDDAWFWRRWAEHGKTLYLANDVVVGHMELMIAWTDVNLEPVYQRVSEWWKDGKPANAWHRSASVSRGESTPPAND